MRYSVWESLPCPLQSPIFTFFTAVLTLTIIQNNKFLDFLEGPVINKRNLYQDTITKEATSVTKILEKIFMYLAP